MRNRALGVYSVFGGSGFSLGLVLSGLLTAVNWRWTLLVPAPVALIVLVAGWWLIPRDARERSAQTRGQAGSQTGKSGMARRPFDLPGALTVTLSLLLLVYTVTSGQQAGWASPRTIGSFVLIAAGLVAFIMIESRSRDPLLPLRIFRSARLRRANIGAVILFGSFVSFQFLATQYLQSLAGWSPLTTALGFLPAGATTAVLSARMGGLLGRFGAARCAVAAFVSLAAGYVVFLRVGVTPDYPSVLLPTMVLVGLAFGLGFSALSVPATEGLPDEEQGLAAALFQTSFQVGGALVLAIVTAVVDAGGGSRVTTPAATLAAYRPAFFLITGVAMVGVLVALSGLRRAADVTTVDGATVATSPGSSRWSVS
jgi:predicted MFS family arabinose efflux permease